MIFSLTIVADADLAREAAGAHRLFGRIASGRVGQNLPPLRIDIIEQVLLSAIADVDPPHRDRDDLGAALLDRGAGLLEIRVLSGPDD